MGLQISCSALIGVHSTMHASHAPQLRHYNYYNYVQYVYQVQCHYDDM
jgi:hypothetical protein